MAWIHHISGWGIYWLVWFFAGFGFAEAYGLIWNTADTLSEQFWHLESANLAHPFDLADWTWVHFTLGAILLIGFLWLFLHLSFGLLR
jgi:hypothetical protein